MQRAMLRITENSDADMIRLRLDGTVNSDGWREVEEICLRHRNKNGKPIVLDMGGIVFLHTEVAARLMEIRGERLRLINCSPFIESLFKALEK